MSDPTVETLQLLIEANDRRLNDLMAERDLRHQQRYEASSEALDSALGCAKGRDYQGRGGLRETL